MLAEQGKLNIEDNIGKYIPEYVEIGKDITIHHLLNHTSGIKNKTLLSEKHNISKMDMSPKELLPILKMNLWSLNQESVLNTAMPAILY
jgi:CubicO group peptidase (beta-lactamase class C family)